jgi:hypothetical protein
LAHLLILTDQLRLAFRRTHEERSNPEEQLVDLIAGRCGFLRDVIERHGDGPLTLDRLDQLRQHLCVDASRQAATIGLVNAWPTACVLVHAELALKSEEQRAHGHDEIAVPKLRATHVSVNSAARDLGIVLFRNIRVPEESVITKVAKGDAEDVSDVENLAWWEAAGKHLDPLPVRVHARRTYAGVEALLVPILANAEPQHARKRVHQRRQR